MVCITRDLLARAEKGKGPKGKGPRALVARRILALTDSIAFVVKTMPRISVSKRRNGETA